MDKDIFNMTDEELLRMADQTDDDFDIDSTKVESDPDAVINANQDDTVQAGQGDDTLDGNGDDTLAAGENGQDDVFDPNDFKLDRTSKSQTLEEKLNAALLKGTEPKVDDTAKTPEQTAKKDEATKQEPVNYEQAYNQLMGEFVANGKKFKPSSVEEAVSLMQMGSNYTKKMQEIAPSLKLVKLLKENNINDINEIGFLIDLKNHKKDAVEKLLLDSKIDPLDLDSKRGSQYKTNVPQVDDSKQALQDVIDEVVEFSTNGLQAVQTINQTWDDQSKNELIKEPLLVKLIDAQMQNGIYHAIASEIERRQILGKLPRNIPFLQAYQAIGDEFNKAGKFDSLVKPVNNAAKILDTRAGKPQQRDDSAAKRAAASPTGQVKTKQNFDPLKMSDEELMKFIK